MPTRRLFLSGLAGAALVRGAIETLSELERDVFRRINVQREHNGVAALSWNPALVATSRAHSRRMIEAHFFGHDDPDLGNAGARLTAAGISWARCAENVFRENNYANPASIAVVEWLYSPGHRNNLMSAVYKETGVGVAVDDSGNYFFTQQFVLEMTGEPRRKR